MLGKIWRAIDRLASAIDGLAERFERADRDVSLRLAGAEPAAIEGTKPAHPGDDGPAEANGRQRKEKAGAR